MATQIGPHFPDELRAAGLVGLPFSWSPDGTLQFDERMTPDQIAAVRAVLASHNPATPADAPPDSNDLATLRTRLQALAADASVSPTVKQAFAALVALLKNRLG